MRNMILTLSGMTMGAAAIFIVKYVTPRLEKKRAEKEKNKLD